MRFCERHEKIIEILNERSSVTVQFLADKLSSVSVEEIEKLPCMPQGRADVISGGAVLLATLMKKLGIADVIVSDNDNLEGYAIKRGLME